MEFSYVELKQIANVTKLAGYEFTKHIKYSDEGEIIAIRALNVKKGFLDLTNVKKIDVNTSNALLRSKLYKDEIVITYTGSKYGDVAIIEENNKYHLAPNVAKISVKEDYNPYFYYLVTQSPMFQAQLKSNGVGSSQPTIPMKNIRTLKVPIPSKEVQDRITDFFKDIYDKLKLNNDLIESLEQLSQTLFKQWFIDFEFPNEEGKPYKSSGGEMVESELGEIPKGWNVKSLDEIAKFQNGLAMQKFRPEENAASLPVLKIKELNQGNTTLNSERCSLDIKQEVKVFDGDVIFSWSGTLLVKLWTGGDAGLNQHLFKVTSEKYEKWFYYVWTKHYLKVFQARAAEKATTMGHIKRSHLNDAKIYLPPEEILKRATDLIQPIIEKIVVLGIENKNLTQLRDTLLPKLLSGEIEIPDDLEV